jgi:hypothetical protein
MVTAKKLLCGHLFHVHCLRSWLERQQTCPTCRAPVVAPEGGQSAHAVGGEARPPVLPRQQYRHQGSLCSRKIIYVVVKMEERP